ncbi:MULTISPECIES: S-layer family protein [unclassified Nodularia (in: cyanobacteria)]|uniref:beta strand repeat-containing protein n=1 Tax=unclassified Nodularia (in: cyanobacteria) TaxID=2656917 RepID=UPI00187F27FB|nr:MULTISPECIES: S-layer family protein [unclassified Nodularia (in: cyanobacteria)]MBE9200505.1 S-layer family protein [Nodularia sp. LEGE 06071]MCC2691213.1 S-layer family protein [Nodularia sp. LEGE 04288]
MKLLAVGWDVGNRILASVILLPLGIFLGIDFANAQINSDASLNSTVSQNGNHFTITNGSASGKNLFHSFSNFSVPSGGSATFDLINTSNISTIFNRVTAGNVSHIDGMIQTINHNNPVSLFLINPTGIVFGENASVNVSGSFVGTTAESVVFADGFKFNASDTTTPPLLTMSTPVGLQLGANAGAIRTQGTPASNFFLRPSQTFQAQTLALVGSEININQTSLTNPDGRVELWALKNAEVGLHHLDGWQFISPVTADWGMISLRQSSLIDTSGINGGAINIQGRGLTIQEGSGISSATTAWGTGQDITVKTTEFVDLLGVSSPENYSTPGIFTSVFGTGAKAGDITIETERLRIANGAWLQSINYGFAFDFLTFTPTPITDASTGNITVRAKDIEVSGYNPFADSFTGMANFQPSAITTLVTGGERNNSGSITIEADRVRLLNGGRISTDLVGSSFPGFELMTTGTSGDISIQAAESLEIQGVTPGGMVSAVISAIQPFADGSGGNITINTGGLQLWEGGTVSSALSGAGTAGNIDIHAQDIQVSDPVIDIISQTVSGITVAVSENAVGSGGNINIRGDRLRVFNGGQITSSSLGQGAAGSVNLQVNDIDVQGISPSLFDGRQLPSTITAASDNAFTAQSVNIIADSLRVRDQAEISVSNSGTGNAGNLNIVAHHIFLDNAASLKAELNGGGRGNIRLLASDFLLLRNGSKIITNADGASTGGNININADLIVAVPKENSDISANAVVGSGGNIQITTQGLFGLQFREQLTPESDITASSEFGINGTVQINTVGVDPNSGLVELPANVSDPSQQIVTGCMGSEGSRFVAIGRGGIPQNPNQQVWSDRTWSDIRDLSTYQQTQALKAPIPKSPESLVQATSWRRNTQGQVELMANKSSAQVQQPLTCAAVTQN